MARLISAPTVIEAAGTPSKTILEFAGRVATATAAVSIAVMHSPAGWSEPAQRPEFDEYSVVLDGVLTAETADGQFRVPAGQAIHIPAGEWVRYSTPAGARYVSVCLPAFSPETVHRDG
jgi:mannose-6-phosphate isomerase-like protein (cupin superfamily)